MGGYGSVRERGGARVGKTALGAGLLLLCVSAVSLAIGVAEAPAAKRVLKPNPANEPTLIGMKMDPIRYDGAGKCRKKVPAGTRALKKWLKQNTMRGVYSNAIRCDGGVHNTGRALDWSLDARKKKEKRKADRVVNTWLAKDDRGRRNALARRMGVQLIIWNCKFWLAGDTGMRKYSACKGTKNPDPTQGHIDHIHVELTKPAAKLNTSFWRSEEAPGNGNGGGVSPE